MPYHTPSSTDPFSLRYKNMSFETIYQICRITQPHFMQFLIGIRIRENLKSSTLKGSYKTVKIFCVKSEAASSVLISERTTKNSSLSHLPTISLCGILSESLKAICFEMRSPILMAAVPWMILKRWVRPTNYEGARILYGSQLKTA